MASSCCNLKADLTKLSSYKSKKGYRSNKQTIKHSNLDGICVLVIFGVRFGFSFLSKNFRNEIFSIDTVLEIMH